MLFVTEIKEMKEDLQIKNLSIIEFDLNHYITDWSYNSSVK